MKDLIIGCHVSFKNKTQLLDSVKEALSYNANTFMFYTGAPQNTNRAEISDDITLKAMELMKEVNIDVKNVVVHAPYIINPANTANLEFAITFLKQEISRVERLGISKLVLHPGSHVGLGEEIAIQNIINVLNSCLTKSTNVDICIETMAGKGSEIGSNFDQIKQIINGVLLRDKIKICLDTCHLNDAGYDIKEFDKILDEIENTIGLDKIACVHINDSKNVKGSHKDRHQNIGFGEIGFDNLINVIYNERIKNVPKILETPYVGNSDDSKERLYPPYKFEIEMIRERKQNHNLLQDIRDYYK